MTTRVSAEPYRLILRELWRTYTYGEMAAATGIGVSTLCKILHGNQQRIEATTAAALRSLVVMLPAGVDQ